jgi:hypothetical protein
MSQPQLALRSSQSAVASSSDQVPDESAAQHRATAAEVADFMRDLQDAHRPAVLLFVTSIVHDLGWPRTWCRRP